jgi:hypothetical protein
VNHRVLVFALWFVCSLPLWGQVFPEEEYLDVITMVDRSVLTGVVADDVDLDEFSVDATRVQQGLEPLLPPGSTLSIEIYGGSTFVIASENIQRISRRRNPDFGKAPPTISLEEMLARGTAALVGSDDAIADGGEGITTAETGRALLADGWFFGVSGTVGNAVPVGSGWDDVIDTLDGTSIYGNKQGLEVYVERFHPFGSDRRIQPSWGFRGGVGFYETYAGFKAIPDVGRDPSQGVEYFYVPLEGLIGIGGGRLFGFVGAGVGFAIHTTGPDDQWKSSDAVYDWPEYDDGFIPSFVASVGGIIRIGTNWAVEGRVFYERDLASWYVDFEQYVTIAPGATLGVAYRRGR